MAGKLEVALCGVLFFFIGFADLGVKFRQNIACQAIIIFSFIPLNLPRFIFLESIAYNFLIAAN
jgi:hypothetical protein